MNIESMSNLMEYLNNLPRSEQHCYEFVVCQSHYIAVTDYFGWLDNTKMYDLGFVWCNINKAFLWRDEL